MAVSSTSTNVGDSEPTQPQQDVTTTPKPSEPRTPLVSNLATEGENGACSCRRNGEPTECKWTKKGTGYCLVDETSACKTKPSKKVFFTLDICENKTTPTTSEPPVGSSATEVTNGDCECDQDMHRTCNNSDRCYVIDDLNCGTMELVESADFPGRFWSNKMCDKTTPTTSEPPVGSPATEVTNGAGQAASNVEGGHGAVGAVDESGRPLDHSSALLAVNQAHFDAQAALRR